MLKLENISVTLGKGSPLEKQVLKNLNLNIKKGEFIIIVGGNGAGKSTMFNTISGAIFPDKGKIILDRKDITKTSQTKRAAAIATVLQNPKIGTMGNMTIFENLAFAYKRGLKRRLFPYTNKYYRNLFYNKIKLLEMGLENRLDAYVSSLSGGQCQALSLIMAVTGDSQLLLLDEVTAALDHNMAENVMQLSANIIKKEQKTAIMITHNMDHAIKYGDRIFILSQGQIIKEFSTEDKGKLKPLDLTTTFQ